MPSRQEQLQTGTLAGPGRLNPGAVQGHVPPPSLSGPEFQPDCPDGFPTRTGQGLRPRRQETPGHPPSFPHPRLTSPVYSTSFSSWSQNSSRHRALGPRHQGMRAGPAGETRPRCLADSDSCDSNSRSQALGEGRRGLSYGKGQTQLRPLPLGTLLELALLLCSIGSALAQTAGTSQNFCPLPSVPSRLPVLG